jgi:hypothetical protein
VTDFKRVEVQGIAAPEYPWVAGDDAFLQKLPGLVARRRLKSPGVTACQSGGILRGELFTADLLQVQQI